MKAGLLLLLLGLWTHVAGAGQPPGRWGEALAQMSEEDRRELEMKWQRLPPMDQAILRQRLRDELLELPPERRESHRREILERWRGRTGPQATGASSLGERDDRDDAGQGFGFGYERRHDPRERPGRR